MLKVLFIYFKDARKSCNKLSGEKIAVLSDVDFFVFFFFCFFVVSLSDRLSIQECGHIFTIRILLLALRQSIQGCGRTTSVQIPRRI